MSSQVYQTSPPFVYLVHFLHNHSENTIFIFCFHFFRMLKIKPNLILHFLLLQWAPRPVVYNLQIAWSFVSFLEKLNVYNEYVWTCSLKFSTQSYLFHIVSLIFRTFVLKIWLALINPQWFNLNYVMRLRSLLSSETYDAKSYILSIGSRSRSHCWHA